MVVVVGGWDLWERERCLPLVDGVDGVAVGFGDAIVVYWCGERSRWEEFCVSVTDLWGCVDG